MAALADPAIAKAIDATRATIPGYFESTLAQRAGLSETAAGSVYEGVDADRLEQMLRAAEWESYSHEAVMTGCTAFRAAIPGKLGIVGVASLPSDTVVTLDDRKDTGKVSAVVEGVRAEDVDFTVVILGEHEGAEVVFTFHPGDPIAPSLVPAEGQHGREVSIEEALSMGLEMAKIA